MIAKWYENKLPKDFKILTELEYRKVMNSSMSSLVAPPKIYRLFMSGKFNADLLWPLWEKLIFATVAQSTFRDSAVVILE